MKVFNKILGVFKKDKEGLVREYYRTGIVTKEMDDLTQKDLDKFNKGKDIDDTEHVADRGRD